MYLTDQDVAEYHRDGYLLVPSLFSPSEVNAMLRDVEGTGRVSETTT